MTRIKIDYGIDLGTTNSSIARMEQGEPVIIKNEYGMDTTPSCIHFNKKGTRRIGKQAYNSLDSERVKAFKKNDPSLINAFEEFKRVIGTDVVVDCPIMGRSFTPEELSAEVLRKLKGYIQDEPVNAAVITVPAKFQGSQKDATKEAAKLAGFQHCLLLQEPIAASMAYGVKTESIDGFWVVFDFGGGTFDAALMKVEEGIMKVVDTEGDNYLGGKNIDYAIVDNIIISYLTGEYSIDNILSDEGRKRLLRDSVKRYAEEAKIALSSQDMIDILSEEPLGEDDNGRELVLDLSVTKEEYNRVVKPIFQRAIDIAKKLLANNNLSGSDLKTVLMIGGPTFSQTLREMVKDQITSKINVSIDPMTAVAKGAALFASTKSIPDDIRVIDNTKIQLTLVYPETTVEIEENIGIRINRNDTGNELPEILFADIVRLDGWSSGKVEITDDSEVLPISLLKGKPNVFQLTITDDKGNRYPSEPDSFTIIQGFKAAKATLPFDLCIDAFELSAGKQHLVGFDGLAKNQPLPAKGNATFQTQADIRPGNTNDRIRIPIYYGEKGTKAIYNAYRAIVVITGEQLPAFLPKGSDVDLSIEVTEDEMIKVSASFPYLDDEFIETTLEKQNMSTPPTEELSKDLAKATITFEALEEEYDNLDLMVTEQIQSDLNELDSLLAKGGSDPDTRHQVLNRIREISKQIDELKNKGEAPKLMEELAESLEHLKESDEQYGDDKSGQLVRQLSEQAEIIIGKNDPRLAKDIIKQIRSVDFAIVDKSVGVAMEVSLIKGFDDEFDMHEWKNRNHARRLIEDAKNIINSNRATKSNLRPIVGELFSILPTPEQAIIKPDKDVLMK